MQKSPIPRLCIALPVVTLLAGCGYVGEPLPPALNIASPVRDLRVVEYGDHIIVDFTIPPVTTEGVALKRIGTIDLRAGPGGNPFETSRWAADAKRIPVSASAAGAVQTKIPVSDFANQAIIIGVRIVNPKGRASEWSNLVPLIVTPPLPRPTSLAAQATAAGVRVTWQGPGSSYRIYRATGSAKPALIGNSDRAEYLDSSTQYGQTYNYIVQAVNGTTESDVSQATTITPIDTFAPAVPAGLTAVAGIGSIELVWDRNTEPDLRGYRVYRAAGDGPFERIAEMVDTPSYSDRQIEAGKRYRYEVSSVDQAGNESAKSAIAEATGP